METKVTTVVETKTDKITFGYFNEDTEQWVKLGEYAEDAEIQRAANLLNCSPELLGSILALIEDIKMNVRADLSDIWEKVNR